MHQRLKAVCRHFIETTSAHGFGQVSDSKNILQRIFWLLICIAGLSAVVAHLTILLMHYYTYPKAVNIKEAVELMPFPHVTICITTTWAYTRLNKNTQALNNLRSIVSQLDKALMQNMPNEDKRMARVNEIVVENAMLRNETESQIMTELGSYLLNLDDILIQCTFNEALCNLTQDFLSVRTQVFPKCFKFRKLGSTNKMARNFLTGLNALFFIPEEQIIDDHKHSIGLTTGIIIYTMDSNKHANYLRDDPVLCPMGLYCNVGVSFVQVNRTSTINDPCNGKHELLESFDNKQVTSFQYSPADCTDGLANEQVVKQCGCLIPNLPINPDSIDHNTRRPCLKLTIDSYGNITNTLQIKNESVCMETITKDLLTRPIINRRCVKSCFMTELVKEVSAISMPYYNKQMSAYSDTIVARYNQLNNSGSASIEEMGKVLNSNKTELLSSSVLHQNFAQINVFLKASPVTTYSESLSYTAISLISEIGGVTGLWIGGSILTIIEFVQLFTVLIATAFQKTKENKTEIIQRQDSWRDKSVMEMKNNNSTNIESF